NVAMLAQKRHQPRHSGDLFLGGGMVVEITDQADADPVLVPPVIVARLHAGVRPMFLLGPARSNEDLSIAVSNPVPDDKVISQLIPPALLMPRGHAGRRAAVVPRMMDDDVVPPRRKPVWGKPRLLRADIWLGRRLGRFDLRRRRRRHQRPF